ncbi:hypothetical protein FHS85_003039 [Rhodoligotrophos appendicifer]|uniref:polyketide cyclase n=1 Tax=Rhodoligotrophos appendicifer TaxID=987056 RepID=UPI0011851CAC
MELRILSITIARDWQQLYEQFWAPEAFPLWASGLTGSELRRDGDAWIATGPNGPVRLRFTAHNAFGIMDHYVELGDGGEIYVPLRIIPNGDGAEVIFVLYRQPGMSAEQFAADAEWVARDLEALRRLAA